LLAIVSDGIARRELIRRPARDWRWLLGRLYGTSLLLIDEQIDAFPEPEEFVALVVERLDAVGSPVRATVKKQSRGALRVRPQYPCLAMPAKPSRLPATETLVSSACDGGHQDLRRASGSNTGELSALFIHELTALPWL
jgi:hypothetical protein